MSNASNNARAVFVEAVEYPLDQRAAFLDEACGGDEALRARVERLLRSHDQLGSFHDAEPEAAATIQQSISEKPGTLIGPYKLLQQIGEGGMGIVYLAEQKEPVKRRVALKIIKPGMDTRQVIARFEAERQALAMMDHPNIAKVLDAGQTESGRPYFVMELVNGLPVTKFCDEQHLTPKERLELFIPICQAVQHAHQKGIIHRDLKPSNLLVALFDGQPVPKIIDFGVAKATSQTLTDKTMFTQLGQVVGTLEYMSPEQAERNQLDIDTRSDIYSLGVVLYELLTGETPFDREKLRSAAFEEMLRIIREEEPSKPSTKVSSSRSLPSIAANRRIEPARLGSMIRGELDWIVLKAMEKDRSRRYETASKFAEDVQHYLSDTPVSACPPTRAYRFKKFARKHKKALTTLALTVALLLVGIAGTSWQALVAAGERDRATAAEAIALEAQQKESRLRIEAETARAQSQIDAERSNVALQAMVQMLSKGTPYSEGGKPANYTVREMLFDFSQTFPTALQNKPEISAELHRILGRAFVNVDGDRAERHLQQALKFREQVYGKQDVKVAQSLLDYADFRWLREADFSGSEELNRRALLILLKHPEELDLRLEAYRNLVTTAARLKQPQEADRWRDEMLEFAKENHVTTNLYLAQGLKRAGENAYRKEDFEEAEQLVQLAFQHFPPANTENLEYAWFLTFQAKIKRALQKFDEAEANYKQSIESFEKEGTAYHFSATNLLQLQSIMETQGRGAQFELFLTAQSLEAQSLYRFFRTSRQLKQKRYAAYQQGCKEFVEFAQNSANRQVLDYVTFLCTFNQQALDDWSTIVQLANRLNTLEYESDVNSCWYKTTLGALLYRSGDYEAALQILIAAERQGLDVEASESWRNVVRTRLWFFLAMTHYQLGQVDQANQWYAQAKAELDHLLASARMIKDINMTWGSNVLVDLQREARELLQYN